MVLYRMGNTEREREERYEGEEGGGEGVCVEGVEVQYCK
jgi:hypothetical protein